MHLRAGWVVIGLVVVAGSAWYLARDPDQSARDAARKARAEQAAAEIAADAEPMLYRWRDAKGQTHVTQEEPQGVRYERVPVRPRDTNEVDGRRR